MKIVVISAVNIVEAGPLTILRDCLEALSRWVMLQQEPYRIIAIVHKRTLVEFPNVVYMETTWPKLRWVNRLWFEYGFLRKISRDIGPVYLWFSLHDTTPSVQAEHRAVYCHNAFAFYKWQWKDLVFSPRIALLALFTKYVYGLNIQRNSYLVVQQAWFREAMHSLFNVDRKKIIVAAPERSEKLVNKDERSIVCGEVRSFIYAASPNSHKNFEAICKAVAILNDDYNRYDFEVYITVSRNDNRYARWLNKNWGDRSVLKFIGFLTKDELEEYYERCDCLIFPSRVESWGLPISEFGTYGKPMLLADLPYAHETAGGCDGIAFFDPERPEGLAKLMVALLDGNQSVLVQGWKSLIEEPKADSWRDLFDKLLEVDTIEKKNRDEDIAVR